MNGLLDFINSPEGQGLLSATFGGLAGAGHGGTMNTIGRAGLAGLQGYGVAQDRKLELEQNTKRNQMYDLQLAQAKRAAETEDAIHKAGVESYRTPEQMSLMGGGGPTIANAEKISSMKPGFDQNGFIERVMQIDPLKGIAIRQSMAKETPFGKVDPKDYTPESVAKFAQTHNFGDLMPARKMEIAPGGQVYNPYAIQAGQVLADPNKPFSIGSNGGLVPNTQYQTYEINKAHAGAPRTDVRVNTEKSLLNDIAGGLGKSIVDARGAAQGAAGSIQTLSRLNDALNSGKILAGPGSTFKQYGLQVGNMLGLNGKDANETLLNTRQAVQSLSQLELDAAQQMKGQGQITENERAILRRAASGDIDSMTTSELKLLTGVLDRSARYKIKNYQSQVAPLKNNPNAATIAPFLDVQEPDALPSASPVGGIKFMGFE